MSITSSAARGARAARTSAVLGGIVLAIAGCNMDVNNPSVVDASTFDPTTDASLLSLSSA